MLHVFLADIFLLLQRVFRGEKFQRSRRAAHLRLRQNFNKSRIVQNVSLGFTRQPKDLFTGGRKAPGCEHVCLSISGHGASRSDVQQDARTPAYGQLHSKHKVVSSQAVGYILGEHQRYVQPVSNPFRLKVYFLFCHYSCCAASRKPSFSNLISRRTRIPEYARHAWLSKKRGEHYGVIFGGKAQLSR